ncbi:MAG: sulfide/dihydroorotate dehydrogenase-like FAD/NAD-binding protein [Methanocellales archaeon]|nr:sulfide/dihydroorotate dehydrogenase-like FAD/NAD-binding protein [Methanocellales archaeon]
MCRIVAKKELAPTVKSLTIDAPLIAKKARPGQFIIIRIDEKGERIPLTIADLDVLQGTITTIFLEVGKTTKHLGSLNDGDVLADLAGPLGKPTEIKKYGKVICVGGGVGVAPLYLEAKALKDAGNKVISIIGARTKELLILEKEMRRISDELYITTDDGSRGHHGFVTDVLQGLITKQKIDMVLAIGPTVMMKAVAKMTKNYNIKTIVSLNPIMVDGTGMCGTCRVTVGGETKFTCVDGPEFDAHLVDFEELMNRQRTYLEEEKVALERWERCHH